MKRVNTGRVEMTQMGRYRAFMATEQNDAVLTRNELCQVGADVVNRKRLIYVHQYIIDCAKTQRIKAGQVLPE